MDEVERYLFDLHGYLLPVRSSACTGSAAGGLLRLVFVGTRAE